MSFWKDNPFSPTWTGSIGSWWSSTPPRLLVSVSQTIPFTKGQGTNGPFTTGSGALGSASPSPFTQSSGQAIQFQKATVKDVLALCEFWRRYFSITSNAICQIPSATVLKGIEEGRWEIWMAVGPTGEIVGTGVRKWISQMEFQKTVFQQAAMIDYFCVHPAWRKKGIGRQILQVLHNNYKGRHQGQALGPLPPHLILWEGIAPSFPPAAWGLFWAKRCRPLNQKIFQLCKREEAERIWAGFQGQLKSRYEGNEVSCYRTFSGAGAGALAIWNTFHKSPEGGWIGIVVAATDPEIVNEFSSNTSPFSVLLASRSLASGEGWVADSPFQFILYNCSYSVPLLQEFPLLGL